VVDELLTLALQPKKEGLGGVDKYLIHKLSHTPPLDIKSAMSRLVCGMQHSIKVRNSRAHWELSFPASAKLQLHAVQGDETLKHGS
jgi:hypothetical protein